MSNNLARDAILAALSGNWKEALEINLQILKDDPKDIDALNRLARAYAECGNFKKAKETAQKALKIDPFNSIAVKALEKWKGLKKGESSNSHPTTVEMFLEEPGKTKVVSLLFPGSPKILAKLDCGDEVKLNTHSHRLSCTTSDGKYVGRLPDDLSARLRKLIQLGNEYQAIVKSVNTHDAKIFIRETYRAPGVKDVSSFSTEKIDYVSFTPPELVHKKDDIETGIEEEE